MNPVIRVWVNGALYDSETPAISATDHGVTVGDGIFETCKIERGQPFALSRHLQRLLRSAAGLGLPDIDIAVIEAGIRAVLADGDPIDFGRLRFTVTAGSGPLGSDRYAAPLTYVVTAAPQARPVGAGILCVTPWTRNERSAVAGLKTTSYAENVVALAFARERGASEAIFANTRGELCEGTASNLFVVVGGTLHTPPLSSGCLAGITRELTIQWCREAGLEVVEDAMPLGVLRTCEEVFITSSLGDIYPIERIDEHRLTAPGPVTEKAALIFAERAGGAVDP